MTTIDRFIRPLAGLLAGMAIFAVTYAAPVSAHNPGWAANNCGWSGNGTDLSIYKKSSAQAYALIGRGEGYNWGGGCWNDSNSDNQPNDPPGVAGHNGEGGDCSGFTFKSWALENGYGVNGKQEWNRTRYIHGPYAARDFKNAPSNGAPLKSIGKSSAYTMEAFASDTHIGMIYTPNTSQGQDRIIEAECEACGTRMSLKNYRSSSSYEAVMRTGWTPECYPRCV